MGNNQSVSSSSADFAHSSNGGSVPNIPFGSSSPFIEEDSSIFDDIGSLSDKNEEYLAQVIHQIMAKDEVLAIIHRSLGEPSHKKAKQVRKRKRRCTAESLQQSVWGQLMLSIQEEIAESGVLPLSDLQKTFRLRFREDPTRNALSFLCSFVH